ncbi:MAG TPA: leucine-rich repeat domain-containing protein [Candidatus Hydrogenedentes bacterium]|nr:leucine-rich repeat domain-containing protein [Candidatus Hydrogenedentota bacterium]HNT86433.1 leucine-rich repeat domain-containing protein [Candidatus Hydrogenedentota bacterium]
MVGLVGLLGCLSLGLAGCPCIGGPFLIRDAALESAVRAALGKPFGCLSRNDLLRVTEIQAANLNIHTLDGIENCKNLRILNLKNNLIQSITPLTTLINLTFLDLGFNEVSHLEPLAGLFFLDQLYLDGNEILDLKPLVANAVNGGLGDGDILVLPATVLGSDNEIQEIFRDDVQTLHNAGVRVFVEDRP